MKQVKLNPSIDAKLSQLSEQRKKAGQLVSTKQGIVAELIIKLHEKEVQRGKVGA